MHSNPLLGPLCSLSVLMWFVSVTAGWTNVTEFAYELSTCINASTMADEYLINTMSSQVGIYIVLDRPFEPNGTDVELARCLEDLGYPFPISVSDGPISFSRSIYGIGHNLEHISADFFMADDDEYNTGGTDLEVPVPGENTTNGNNTEVRVIDSTLIETHHNHRWWTEVCRIDRCLSL